MSSLANQKTNIVYDLKDHWGKYLRQGNLGKLHESDDNSSKLNTNLKVRIHKAKKFHRPCLTPSLILKFVVFTNNPIRALMNGWAYHNATLNVHYSKTFCRGVTWDYVTDSLAECEQIISMKEKNHKSRRHRLINMHFSNRSWCHRWKRMWNKQKIPN